MKALFLCPDGYDCDMIITCWELFNEPIERDLVDVSGTPRDEHLLSTAKAVRPDVMFYVDGAGGTGSASVKTLKALRDVAPFVHLCFDAGDYPWFPFLEEYKKNECFDLQVGLTGIGGERVDLVTLVPINYTHYEMDPSPTRDIECGFAGGLTPGDTSGRTDVLQGLIESGHLTTQLRGPGKDYSYQEYVDFLRRCHRGVNASVMGTGTGHSIKMRVTEYPLAGAALLETTQSPVRDWYPKEYIYFYETIEEAQKIIQESPLDEVRERAEKLKIYARKHYSPEMIYKEILERIGL